MYRMVPEAVFWYDDGMKQELLWEQFYTKTPLNKIPWQNTQADYFTEVIESGKVKPGLALDLGCGTGMKSIFLAKKGFDVIGIDISETAIDYARGNASNAKVKVEFITADATDLNFFKNKRFDFILDWANLHGIPQAKRNKYVNGIVEHSKKDCKLLLRCFSKRDTKNKYVKRPMGIIYLFSKKDIEILFGKYFKILEINKSKPPSVSGNPPSEWLDEYLMERL